MPTETDVAIIGAGLSGLACARRLAALDIGHVLIEARAQPGGRAQTRHPARLGGHAFDRGAQWFHDSHRNPLLDQVRAAGIAAPEDPAQGLTRAAGAPEGVPAYEDDHAIWAEALTARARAGGDVSLAEASAAGPALAWQFTLEAWEAEIICAAPAGDLSLRDWAANRLLGGNAASADGLGAALAQITAAERARARCGIAARRISATPDGVSIITAAGEIRARRAVLTASVGVLRQGGISFEPGLPAGIEAALDGLCMGQAAKIACLAVGGDRLGLPPGADLMPYLSQRGEAAIVPLMWPHGLPYATGFCGGSTAAAADRLSPRDAAALLRAAVARACGAQAARIFAEEAEISGWGQEPFILGAYAYCRPGHAGARAALAQPIWEGRLRLAGEAVAPDGLAGTVAGAWRAGEIAAEQIGAESLDARFPRQRDSLYTVRP